MLLAQQQRDDRAQHLTMKELRADLRVAHVQAEQAAHEQVIAEAVEPADQRVVNRGPGQALGTDRGIDSALGEGGLGPRG